VSTDHIDQGKDTVDTEALLNQIARGAIVAIIPNQRPPDPNGRDDPLAPIRRWYSMQEVADMLGYGLSKVKMLVITREIRSVKDGKYRRILPEWVDEYVARRVEEVDL
jgi:excisionase family DNA binding protein